MRSAMLPGGTVARRASRGWLIAGSLVLAVVALAAISLALIYPRVGAWMVRKQLSERVASRLGRDVHAGKIEISLGHLVIRDLEVRGPLDGDTPLVHIDRIDVEFDGWASVFGTLRLGAARVDGVVVTLRRHADGRDNVRDVLDRVQAGSGAAAAPASADASGPRPTRVTATHVRVLADDEGTSATVLVNDGDATWTPGDLVAHIRDVTATTIAAPKAVVHAIEIHKTQDAPPTVAIEGGELSLWPELALSGITGTVTASAEHPGNYAVSLQGGYGGVAGRLWTASGDFDPRAQTASLELVAAKFQLDRLAPLLENSPIVDYQGTSVDTKLHLDLARTGVKFAGDFHLWGLNVNYWRISAKEVRDLDVSGQITGSFDRPSRKLELTQGDFVARGVPFTITGAVAQEPRDGAAAATPPPVALTDSAANAATDAPPLNAGGGNPSPPTHTDPDGAKCSAPHELQTVAMHLVIPPVPCQQVLDAIPREIVPDLRGYKLHGQFDADVDLDVDWRDLEATVLGGKIGINHCKVMDAPPDSPKRLKDEFEHFVEVEAGEWESFVVGPSNPEFVPLDDISPYLRGSIMSSEDFGFYKHHGFIPSEFRSALVTNLKSCKFAYGASSITMQMVKNVLLSPEKTLARKLEELFLTWDVENILDKDRIFEIYLNVIEYGPGLYGIGPAARHYFGKEPKDLNPVEAAFFSSILPNPKERYKQYCAGTLTKWTTGKIERQLGVMKRRGQLTDEEYDKALATPLLFVKDGSETEDECMKRVKKAIKNARPTNPNAVPEVPLAPVKKKPRHKPPSSSS
jgi:hypothetical protein